MGSKLADWDDDEPQTLPETSSKRDKVVVLKHMFTPEELEVRRTHVLKRHILTASRRIRPPCWRLKRTSGKNVPSWERSPMWCCLTRKQKASRASDSPMPKQLRRVSGYARLLYPPPLADVLQLMNGRWFDERQLEAYIATGVERFKKSSDRRVGLDDDHDDEDEGGRLDKFGAWLEQEG